MKNMGNITPEITLLSFSVLLFLYYAVSNLFRKYSSAGNKLFVLFNLLFAVNNSFIAYLLMFPGIDNLDVFIRYSFSIIIFAHLVYFYIILLYPAWVKKTSILVYLLFPIPCIFAIDGIFYTDKIILKTILESKLIISFGEYSFILLCAYGLYFLGIIIASVYKSRRMKDTYFVSQLPPMVVFAFLGILGFLVFYIIMPAYYNSYKYSVAGLAVSGMCVAFVMNYALSNERFINFGKLFLKITFRLLIIIILLISVYLFFTEILNLSFMKERQIFIAAAIAFSFLCLALFGIFKSITDLIVNKKEKSMKVTFGKVYNIILEFSQMRKQKTDWKTLYARCIDEVCELLYIEKAILYLLNKETAVYEPVHSFNEHREIEDLLLNISAVSILNKYKRIIDKSSLYTDKEIREYKDMLNFFEDRKYNSALPVFADKNLAGILLLGRTEQKWNYSDFISSLENYRMQFSSLLENLKFSEDIRRSQSSKRDRMVVKNIKKHIMPGSLKNIEGLKVSSLYINNSDFGGDYFNSAKINEDKLGIFFANSSDTGIESAMLSLQINSIFHSQAELQTSPEGLLNVLNQVLCTSQFTEKYATALFMIYDKSLREISFASAAFNPLIIYDPRKDAFVEFDAEGVPVGIDISFRYKHRSLTVPYDGIGICCSPGLSAALDRNGNSYSMDKIKDIIKKNKDDAPADLIRKIYDDFKNFSAAKMLNDITIIIFNAA
jgi:serine phosphatase RsbU (regulator of sigma subunit)